jgi:GNAT superfamily N-acetyltransferase
LPAAGLSMAALSLLVERTTAESFVAEAVVPGVEVHADRDVTWVVHPGNVWRNAAVMIRFSDATAADRLETLLGRYRQDGRGMGLWVSPVATPSDLARFLHLKRFRCRKHYPAMVRILSESTTAPSAPAKLTVRRIRDMGVFVQTPHPSVGTTTTPLRKQAFARLRAFVSDPSERVLAFVAYLHELPVGGAELFLGSEKTAGLLGLSVLHEHRGQGIGAALLEHTCRQALKRGATSLALIATNDGERLYARSGFSEVARFGYWYQSFRGATRPR